MGEQIEQLARHVAETRWEQIPGEVREHAKLVLLDTLGVILAGSEQPEVANLTAALVATGGSGAAVLARGFPRTDPRTAALLNGLAGRSVELCEGHRYVSGQPALQSLPTVLALGEGLGIGGADALAALILSYDAAERIGAGVKRRPLAHANGQWVLLGAIAAGCRVRGFDSARTSLALRIGASLLLTPSYVNAVAGATALNVVGGMSVFAGVLAPDLALAGIEAQTDAIEEAFRELVGDGFDPTVVVEELGERWEIARNYFRLRACCNPIYAALDALEEVLAEVRPEPDQIERIDAATYRFASLMQQQEPRNYFASKYSFPHAAAATVILGNAGYDSFTGAALRNPAIVALRRRVHMSADPFFTQEFPRLKGARVTVTLTDGRQITRVCESARGDYLRPYQPEEVRAKFRELARLVLTPKGVAEAESMVDRLDSVADVGELVRLLRAHSR